MKNINEKIQNKFVQKKNKNKTEQKMISIQMQHFSSMSETSVLV